MKTEKQIEEKIKEAKKIEEDIRTFIEKVNKIMLETSKGYAKQVFKVAMLDIIVNTFVQKFKDLNLENYENKKDILLRFLEERSEFVWTEKIKKNEND